MASELALLLGPSLTSPSSNSLSSSPTSTESLSSQGNLLVRAFPHRVVYQHILFLHQLFMFMSVAVSKVAPVLFPPSIDEIDGTGIDTNSLQLVVKSLEQGSKAIMIECKYIHLEIYDTSSRKWPTHSEPHAPDTATRHPLKLDPR
jgi:hypothetical protein